jgi:hypothetical protein
MLPDCKKEVSQRFEEKIATKAQRHKDLNSGFSLLRDFVP